MASISAASDSEATKLLRATLPAEPNRQYHRHDASNALADASQIHQVLVIFAPTRHGGGTRRCIEIRLTD
jgi:hypothetical protein